MTSADAPQDAPAGVTSSLDRRVVGLFTVAALCIVVASLKLAADLLIPLLLAGFFAMALLPLATRLQRAGMPAAIATVAAFLLGTLLVLALGALVAMSLGDVEEALPRYEAKLAEATADATAWLEERGMDLPEGGIVAGIDPEKAMSLATDMIASVGSALSNAIVVLFVMLLLLFDRAALTGEVAGQGRAVGAKVQRVVKSVTDYLSVKTIISAVTGLLFGIACALIGVDFPVLWGLLAFLLNYVPNIGSILAAVPPILLALIQIGPQGALLVLVANLAVNGILGNVIEPKMMGQKVGLSTLTIFLGLIFWSWVFGPVGTVLSVPLTIVVKMLLEKPAPTTEAAPA